MKKWERSYRRLKKQHEKLLVLFRDILKMNGWYVQEMNRNLTKMEKLITSKKKKGG